jgi:hypothetical protein
MRYGDEEKSVSVTQKEAGAYLLISTKELLWSVSFPIWVLTPNTNGKVDHVGHPIDSQHRWEKEFT